MEKEKDEVFSRSSHMTDETEKTPEDTGIEHTPSVLDEIAAEEAQSPPDDKEQAALNTHQPQDTSADTGTDGKEPQGAEDVSEEDLEDQYKTLQEKIADVDKLLSEVKSPEQETTAPADAAQSEEPDKVPEQAETASEEAAITESSLPDREVPPAETQTTPETVQEDIPDDTQLKTKLFDILDRTHLESKPDASPEAAATEVQDSEPPEEAEETGEPPQESVTSVEASPPPTKTEPEETPPLPEAAASEEETAPAEAPPETAEESSAEPETAPKPASGTEAFSVQMPEVESTPRKQAALSGTLKMLCRPGELMDRFECALNENENIRTAWLVFGCISLGVAGLALLMWLFSSM